MDEQPNHRNQPQTQTPCSPKLPLWGQLNNNPSPLKQHPLHPSPNNMGMNIGSGSGKDIDFEIDIEHKAVPTSSAVNKNRRYRKLRMLWKEGFFQEQEIMGRFPQLYYQYVGKFKNEGFQAKQFTGIADFLQQQAIRQVYRNTIQTSTSTNHSQPADSPFEQSLSPLPLADLQLEQQALLDHLQLKFLGGELEGFDYSQIDKDDSLDLDLDPNCSYVREQHQKEEEAYFEDVEDQHRDRESNTGVQDF